MYMCVCVCVCVEVSKVSGRREKDIGGERETARDCGEISILKFLILKSFWDSFGVLSLVKSQGDKIY